LAAGLPAVNEAMEKDCESGSICRQLPVNLPDENERDHSPGPQQRALTIRAPISSIFEQTFLRRAATGTVFFKGING
jgi:hypothetical protein